MRILRVCWEKGRCKAPGILASQDQSCGQECPHHTNMILDLTDESFHAGALGRIQLGMVVLGVGFGFIVWITLGWRVAAGFACGGLIGYTNFHLLKRVVGGVVERTVASGN